MAVTFTTGEIVSAAKMNTLATPLLNYTEFTSSVSITATTEATANTVVTAGAVTFDGSTPCEVVFGAPYIQQAANSTITIVLYQNGSSIGRWAENTDTSGTQAVPVHVARRLTPTSASHTFSVRAYVSTGTGTVGAGAGGSGNYVPGFIKLVRDQ